MKEKNDKRCLKSKVARALCYCAGALWILGASSFGVCVAEMAQNEEVARVAGGAAVIEAFAGVALGCAAWIIDGEKPIVTKKETTGDDSDEFENELEEELDKSNSNSDGRTLV